MAIAIKSLQDKHFVVDTADEDEEAAGKKFITDTAALHQASYSAQHHKAGAIVLSPR